MYITLILGNGLKVNEKMHPNICKNIKAVNPKSKDAFLK